MAVKNLQQSRKLEFMNRSKRFEQAPPNALCRGGCMGMASRGGRMRGGGFGGRGVKRAIQAQIAILICFYFQRIHKNF